jgi:hypothetical protein
MGRDSHFEAGDKVIDFLNACELAPGLAKNSRPTQLSCPIKAQCLSMNRTPSSHPSPPVGEKVPDLSAVGLAKAEGRMRGISNGSPIRVQSLEVFPTHEPNPLTPSFSPPGEKVPGGRFREISLGFLNVFVGPEPSGSAGLAIWTEFVLVWSLNPITQVKAHHAQGARPSGRFNVHLASGSYTHQTLPTVKRPEGRAPAIRSGWQGSLHFDFRVEPD